MIHVGRIILVSSNPRHNLLRVALCQILQTITEGHELILPVWKERLL